MMNIENRVLAILASDVKLGPDETLVLRVAARDAAKVRRAKQEIARTEYNLNRMVLPGESIQDFDE